MVDEDIGFAWGIIPQRNAEGQIISYRVQGESRGLPDEVVITIMRHWLRMVEDRYQERFSKK